MEREVCKGGIGNWKLRRLHLRLSVMRPDVDNDIVVECASEKETKETENKEDEKDEDKKEQAEGEVEAKLVATTQRR
ncbi:hypothetical protein K0M31_018084 [Melipona bicolor]|uniref:Uncharacterized protein n=1 Tax=Melipona bicolor TaxID=60889 RepID=A0AA40FD51_9HYME|nr:hypothetical protein K0M31_018084 [Melipona bicolor]